MRCPRTRRRTSGGCCERCLRKDPEDAPARHRRSAHRLDEPPAEAPASSPPAARRVILPWVAAAVATIVAVTFAVLWLRRPVEEARAVKFAIAPPEKASFDIGVPVVSPDGRHIVFGASSNGKDQLWLRNLDAAAARPLAGTEGLTPLTYPFWSPDSRFLGFFADGKLKRIDVSGGPARTLCQAASPRGGTWSRQDVIVFNADNNTGLVRVPAVGGLCAPATELDVSRNEIGHRWPSFSAGWPPLLVLRPQPRSGKDRRLGGRSGIQNATKRGGGGIQRSIRSAGLGSLRTREYFDGSTL